MILWWPTNSALTYQRLDDHHGRATVRADKRRTNNVTWCVCRVSIRRGHRRNVQQFTSQRQILFACVVGEQTILTDAVKAAGKNMQQKPPHELIRLQRHGLMARLALGKVIFPAKCPPCLIHRDQSRIRDGHPVVYSVTNRPAPPPDQQKGVWHTRHTIHSHVPIGDIHLANVLASANCAYSPKNCNSIGINTYPPWRLKSSLGSFECSSGQLPNPG